MRRKRYALFLPLAFLAVLFVLRIAAVNKRFPKPVMEYYKIGQSIEINGFEVTAEKVEHKTQEEFQKLISNPKAIISNLESLGEAKHVILTLSIKNITEKSAMFSYDKVSMNILNVTNAMELFGTGGLNPDGIPRQFAAGQKKKVRLKFSFYEVNCDADDWKVFEKQPITVALSLYPIQRLIEIPGDFDNVD